LITLFRFWVVVFHHLVPPFFVTCSHFCIYTPLLPFSFSGPCYHTFLPFSVHSWNYIPTHVLHSHSTIYFYHSTTISYVSTFHRCSYCLPFYLFGMDHKTLTVDHFISVSFHSFWTQFNSRSRTFFFSPLSFLSLELSHSFVDAPLLLLRYVSVHSLHSSILRVPCDTLCRAYHRLRLIQRVPTHIPTYCLFDSISTISFSFISFIVRFHS